MTIAVDWMVKHEKRLALLWYRGILYIVRARARGGGGGGGDKRATAHACKMPVQNCSCVSRRHVLIFVKFQSLLCLHNKTDFRA